MMKNRLTKIVCLQFWVFISFQLMGGHYVSAAEPPAPQGSRNFYQVLDELLADFEYDLKQGQVIGLKDLSIRNIATSENVPNSFKTHLELLITERIQKSVKTRVVHCLACRSKRTELNGQTMVIKAGEMNPAELQRIAKMNGISNFMDVAFAYQPTGMILSLSVSDAETSSSLWSRTYNSETTRAAAARRGVDYQQQSDPNQVALEYQPTLQIKPTLYTVMTPKAGSGYSTALAVGFRMMERYDNRQKEVGFEMNYYFDIPSLIGVPGASEDKSVIYNGVNLTLLFTHAWALFGSEENYNQPRAVILGAIGGTYASGLLGAVARGTYEWRLGKHWAVSGFLGYRPKSTVVLENNVTSSMSGIEGGIGVGYLF